MCLECNIAILYPDELQFISRTSYSSPIQYIILTSRTSPGHPGTQGATINIANKRTDTPSMAIFKNYYFHNLTQRYILAFGSILTDIEIQRQDESGSVLSQVKVPITFSNKEKWAQRALDDAEHTRQEAITLPRIAFQLTDISYDSNRKLARNETLQLMRTHSQKTDNMVYTPVPYQLTFNVDIIAKTQSEMYQIIEQIIPAFVPDIVIKVKAMDNVEFDMPISLGGIMVSDSYDGAFEQRRQITGNMNFTVKTYYFAPINKREIILDIKVPVYEMVDDDLAQSVLYDTWNYKAEDYPELQKRKENRNG